ncbi:hypothetical protein GCM10023149_02770 [Mucilaginibacter gynuensis]|uniref:DinB-like domain-containing protein n=1 Tax=Mucilaginibacter gynuensis TaxID=1302236 RepID=A0ABP8FQJ7_9SPHI
MKLNKAQLLKELSITVTQNLQTFEVLIRDHYTSLNIKPNEHSWSVLQIVEHLNTYNNYYLPAIEKALSQSTISPFNKSEVFKPGLLGNYFVKMMLPDTEGSITKKYKAAKWHAPLNTNADEVIGNYIKGQQQLLQLLDRAANYDLNAIRIPTSLNKLIRIKTEDAFRFLIAHQQRHFVQVQNTLSIVLHHQEA